METGDAVKAYTAIFTNPHGFSEFTITKEPAAEAVLNGVRTILWKMRSMQQRRRPLPY